MPINDIYRNYRYETENFILRQVEESDAPALLKCYSDPEAVALMNDDNCVGGFLFTTIQQMLDAIYYWNHDTFEYARPAIIDRSTGEAVGTMEVFGAEKGDSGVLRLDIRRDFETPETLRELYGLAAGRFIRDFPMAAMVTKAIPAASARRQVLEELGFFGPEDFRGKYHDYYRLPAQKFRRELGIAYCGLACCLCGESEDCAGCKAQSCPGFEQCENFPCVRERGLGGCWECVDFPCGKGMHGSNPRARAFVRFAKEYGTDKLMECLERNYKAGIVYHWPGGLKGDYDLEEEAGIIVKLLQKN